MLKLATMGIVSAAVLCAALPTNMEFAERMQPPLSLSRLFETGLGVEDTDGDGLADAVKAVIVIPDNATAYHAAAAAEMAARLGYQTSALSLPLVRSNSSADTAEGGVVIEIALLHEIREELGREVPSIIPLMSEGCGAVISLPHSESSSGRVAIVGADGPGLHEAAAQFAGRWPNAWEIWGPRTSTLLSKLEQDTSAVLEEAKIGFSGVRLRALVYKIDEERDKNPDLVSEEKRRNLDGMLYDSGEVKAALLEARLHSQDDLERARNAIAHLITEHRRGESVSILNYRGVRETIISFSTPDGAVEVRVPRFGYPARMLRRRPDPSATRKPKEVKGEEIDLSNLYSTEGLFADAMEDKIPDRIETTIALGPEAGLPEAGDLAARLGLECAGVSIPIAAVDPRVDQLVKMKQPILVGEGRGTDHLRKQGKLSPPELSPGQGYIGLVPKAFNKSNAIIVLGDSHGLAAALRYLSASYPSIASHKPGELTLKEVRNRAEKLLGGKNAAGQLWAAVGGLAEELPQLRRRQLSKVAVEIVLDQSLPGYSEAIRSWLSGNLSGLPADVTITGRRDPKPIIEEHKEFDYEVNELKAALSEHLLPAIGGGIGGGSKVDLDIRLSEPREVLDELRSWISAELKKCGTDLAGSSLRLICAYKQGFHWLRDGLLPRLQALPIESVLIRFRPEEPDFSEIRKFYPERSRWLSELYPIDEILARELGIPLDRIAFEMDEKLSQTYEITAFGADGESILSETFTPTTATRNYLEKFPQWASVTSPTGWVRAAVDGTVVLDQRIETDAERFWDYYQESVLQRAYDYVMKETDNKPTLEKQPFFHTLQVEAWMSEPDERLGVDEELVSGIEALHEEIYFNTLDFFNGMIPREGEKLPEEALYTTRIGAPGSIIPLIHPARPGLPPEVKITFLGNSASKNSVTLKWTSRDGREESKVIDLPALKPEEVRLSGIIVGEEGLISCAISVTLPDAESIGRLAEGMPVLQAGSDEKSKRMLFDHPGLEQVLFNLRTAGAEKTLVLRSGEGEAATAAPAPYAPGEQIVPLDHVLGPQEAAEIARRLGAFPGITAYQSGASYQGRGVYTLEILPPTESTHISRAKLITARPTILITGRQHANEISSTSHILRLAELLATDPRYSAYRKKLNIILHPVENPDGAALSMKLIELNPLHMNHAARYTALGVELGTQHKNPDTLLTEALVRPMLWERWLPDIYLNCHGYPSHEWVQPFSGYQPYQFRDYWIPRGWFVYVSHLDDPRSPDHRRASRALLRYIDEMLTSDPELAKLNERLYKRYWRWAGRWQPHAVDYELHGRTLIYWERRGGVPRKPSPRTATTVLEGTPEAMDETAQGPWLGVVVSQGLSYLEAHLRLLAEAESAVEEVEEESGGRVHRTKFRRRPISVSIEKESGR